MLVATPVVEGASEVAGGSDTDELGASIVVVDVGGAGTLAPALASGDASTGEDASPDVQAVASNAATEVTAITP
ncbi:MAG: hypothetical protein QNJ12_18880 [Ilumatobacter sp.]|uniref:hypothetical protein n=1 Tax=Ilumatobacter sp. TaxID=1967498 RepID=UPI0026259726|nr:hypothetical protein [Ilumatobacter sp.]MDJ0770866.1 hypothetical protein [Ilumatobacter sp.]